MLSCKDTRNYKCGGTISRSLTISWLQTSEILRDSTFKYEVWHNFVIWCTVCTSLRELHPHSNTGPFWSQQIHYTYNIKGKPLKYICNCWSIKCNHKSDITFEQLCSGMLRTGYCPIIETCTWTEANGNNCRFSSLMMMAYISAKLIQCQKYSAKRMSEYRVSEVS